MRKLGSKQQKAFDFIKRVNGWHEFDRSTKREILSLEKLGLVEVSLYDRNNVAGSYKLKLESKRITCPQCTMLSINGHPCHETGCPNSGARYDVESGEWIKQRVCGECGCTVDADDPCCNAQDRESYTDNQDRDSYTTDLEESEEQE